MVRFFALGLLDMTLFGHRAQGKQRIKVRKSRFKKLYQLLVGLHTPLNPRKLDRST